MTWQFIPFLLLVALLVFGMYKFRGYLAKKTAESHASYKGPVSDGQHPHPENPVAVGDGAPANGANEAIK